MWGGADGVWASGLAHASPLLGANEAWAHVGTCFFAKGGVFFLGQNLDLCCLM
jgi:hypothetical protein